MCYNCGCGIPDDDMGHPDNITNQTFSELAQKENKSETEVKKGMKEWLNQETQGAHTPNADFDEVFDRASNAWGQSVDEAKKETLKLLEKQNL